MFLQRVVSLWYGLNCFLFLNNSLVSLIPDDNEAHLIQAVTVHSEVTR